LIRIETSAGHGAGTALNKVIDETADEWVFLAKELGLN
jgi:prolyl oligopeptidase